MKARCIGGRMDGHWCDIHGRPGDKVGVLVRAPRLSWDEVPPINPADNREYENYRLEKITAPENSVWILVHESITIYGALMWLLEFYSPPSPTQVGD